MAGTTKLEELLIHEVSGVDDPANEAPGWLIMKAKRGKRPSVPVGHALAVAELARWGVKFDTIQGPEGGMTGFIAWAGTAEKARGPASLPLAGPKGEGFGSLSRASRTDLAKAHVARHGGPPPDVLRGRWFQLRRP